MARIFSWDTKDVTLICLCYVEHATPAQIRYAIRRVRRRLPDIPIIVALFGNAERFEEFEGAGRTEAVQQSLRDVVTKIVATASPGVESHPSPSIAA
jgi:hypothetical protein